MEKREEKKRKVEMEHKFESITAALKAKNYTKRSVPTLNQIKKFLKKEKGVSRNDLESITMDNALEKWGSYA